MGGRTVERMNAQIRYGLAALLAAVLLLVIAAAIDSGSDGPMSAGAYLPYYFAMLLGMVSFVAGIVLLIVGLVRRPSTSAQQSQRD